MGKKLFIPLFLGLIFQGCAHKPPVKADYSGVSPSGVPWTVLKTYDVDQLLQFHEGLELKPYLDGNEKLTIGVGRNLEDTGITKDEALLMLRNDINRVKIQLDKRIPWWKRLSEVRQKVLISMAFNLGIEGLMKFTKMLSAAEDGDFATAADEMLASAWASQVGNRAVELAYLMRNG